MRFETGVKVVTPAGDHGVIHRLFRAGVHILTEVKLDRSEPPYYWHGRADRLTVLSM